MGKGKRGEISAKADTAPGFRFSSSEGVSNKQLILIIAITLISLTSIWKITDGGKTLLLLLPYKTVENINTEKSGDESLTVPSMLIPVEKMEECRTAYYAAEKLYMNPDPYHNDGPQPDGSFEITLPLGNPPDISAMLLELLFGCQHVSIEVSGACSDGKLIEPQVLYMLGVLKSRDHDTRNESLKYFQILYDKFPGYEVIEPSQSDEETKKVTVGKDILFMKLEQFNIAADSLDKGELRKTLALLVNDFGDEFVSDDDEVNYDCEHGEVIGERLYRVILERYIGFMKEIHGIEIAREGRVRSWPVSENDVDKVKADADALMKLVKMDAFKAELLIQIGQAYAHVDSDNALKKAEECFAEVIKLYGDRRYRGKYGIDACSFAEFALKKILLIHIDTGVTTPAELKAVTDGLNRKYSAVIKELGIKGVEDYFEGMIQKILGSSFDPYSIKLVELNDGSIYAAGINSYYSEEGQRFINVIRLNSKGNVQWSVLPPFGHVKAVGQPPFGMVGDDTGVILFHDNDGKYLMSKIRSDGKTIWTSDAALKSEASNYSYAGTDNLIFCTYAGPYSSGPLTAYNRDGTVAWNIEPGKSHKLAFNEIEYFRNELLAIGGSGGALIVAMSDDGEEKWKKEFASSGFVNKIKLLVTSDGRYLFYGMTMRSGAIVMYDKDGKKLWENFLFWPKKIVETEDGGFLAVCSSDPDIVKLDGKGEVVWSRHYIVDNGGFEVFLADMFKSRDGNYVIGGGISKNKNIIPDYLYISKIAPDGKDFWWNLYSRAEYLGVTLPSDSY